MNGRYKTYGLGKSTFSCFLCTSSVGDMMNPQKIKEGFKINRTLKDIKEKAELLR